MGEVWKGINQDNRKKDTSLTKCKGPPSLEEARNTAAVSSEEIDNAVSEFINKIVIEMYESDDGSLKPSSPSGM